MAQTATASIHTYQSGEPAIVNAYLIETPNGIVAIDATQTISDSRAIRAKIERLKKPLLGVILTHGHPDHYAGITNIVNGDDVPVISTKSVAEVARRDDPKWDQVGTALLGNEWERNRTFPNTFLNDGESITLDGVTFKVTELGAGESGADTYWTVDALPGVAFVGDIFYTHMHAFLVDGHTIEWLKNIDRVKYELRDATVLYPGHGGATTPAILDWQRDYIQTFHDTVRSLAKGRSQLTETEKAQVKQRMIEFTGDERLVPYLERSIDSVAAELANSQ